MTTKEAAKEKAREATRRWRVNNRARCNQLARESQTVWRKANPEKHRARAKKWKENNLERAKEAHLEWRQNNREHIRLYSRSNYHKRVYGLEPDGYDLLLIAQGGHCALCSRTPDQERHGKLRVDHDHNKKKGDPGFIRGLLCDNHNVALGKLGDNEAGLLKALEYIRG